MKRLKLALSLLIIIGAPLLGAGARPPAAHAGADPANVVCTVLTIGLCNIVVDPLPDGPGFDPPTCSLSGLDVTGDTSSHHYRYGLDCSGGNTSYRGTYSETASWDFASSTARETFVICPIQCANPPTYHGTWTCAQDPWIASGPMSCSVQALDQPVGWGWPNSEPYGALLLQYAPDGYDTVFTQMLNAYKNQGPAPLPDLTVALTGTARVSNASPDASYTVTVANKGQAEANGLTLLVSSPTCSIPKTPLLPSPAYTAWPTH
jgi:hypothetical protein